MSDMSPLSWKSSAHTGGGAVRDMNENALLELPEVGLRVMADGMGGHSARDLASYGIVKALSSLPEPHRLAGSLDDIKLHLVQLNHRLREIADCEEVHTIGSTVVALIAVDKYRVCVWAGNDRIYQGRGGTLEQFTQDHSLFEELVETGVLRPEESSGRPQSNLVTRAIGVSENLHLDMEIFELRAQDQFILCSDGLDKELAAEDIASLAGSEKIENLSDALIDLAVERSSRDNVTAVCMQVMESGLTGDGRVISETRDS